MIYTASSHCSRQATGVNTTQKPGETRTNEKFWDLMSQVRCEYCIESLNVCTKKSFLMYFQGGCLTRLSKYCRTTNGFWDKFDVFLQPTRLKMCCVYKWMKSAVLWIYLERWRGRLRTATPAEKLETRWESRNECFWAFYLWCDCHGGKGCAIDALSLCEQFIRSNDTCRICVCVQLTISIALRLWFQLHTNSVTWIPFCVYSDSILLHFSCTFQFPSVVIFVVSISLCEHFKRYSWFSLWLKPPTDFENGFSWWQSEDTTRVRMRFIASYKK